MIACLLSFIAGFLSLSIEILWIRLFSYANHSLPQAFSFVLCFYLIGIALGADIGKRFCHRQVNLYFVSGFALLVSSLLDLVSPWLYAYFAFASFRLYLAAVLLLASPFLKAIVFPIAHHLGTLNATQKTSIKLSQVYLANIIGSTLGPLITGFWLLSIFTTQQCFLICCALGTISGLYFMSYQLRPIFLFFSAGVMASGIFAVALIDRSFLIDELGAQLLETKHIVENQYGIVTTYAGGVGGDIVTGGNVYDGRTNLDPKINSNTLNRLLILPVINQPKTILMVGLSVGTWLKLATGFPQVEQIDVVEINPGYLEIIQDYPEQLSALKDPRVNLYIDDGRRWLNSHPDKKYDLIVMNTSYYWRAYASNLLSQEFLMQLKAHLPAKGVIAYNTTDSPDAFKTAASVFKHAYRYINFVIAADFDWRTQLRTDEAQQMLAKFTLDGHPLFDKDSNDLINSFLNVPIVTVEEASAPYEEWGRHVEIITDRNLISEYKYGKRLS